MITIPVHEVEKDWVAAHGVRLLLVLVHERRLLGAAADVKGHALGIKHI
jgi:hypothetical protein